MAVNKALQFFLFKLLIFAVIIFLLDRGLAAFLLRGLDRFYGLDKQANVLFIGHSHTLLGIDSSILEHGLGVPVAKYAVTGANISDRLAMIRHYIGTRPEAVRLVVYDVDDHSFTGAGLSSNSYRLFFPYIDNSDIDHYVKKNVGSWDEYTSRRLLNLLRYSVGNLNLSLRGTLRLYNNNKFGKVNIPALQDEIRAGRRTPITIDQELVEAFRETVRFVRDNKAQLVLLYIPTVDLVNDIDKIRHEQVVNIFKKYAAQDVGIVFLDYNPTFSNRYEFFGDPTHLNKEGQQAITNRALIDLKPLLFKANQE